MWQWHVGLEVVKGLKYLLRAIPIIRQHYPNTRFLIGGDGPQRVGFQTYVAQAGWRDVVFLGRVPAEQLPFALRNSGCLLRAKYGRREPGYRAAGGHGLGSGSGRLGYSRLPFGDFGISGTACWLLPRITSNWRGRSVICWMTKTNVAARRGGSRTRQRIWLGHIAGQVFDYYREFRAEHAPVWGRQIARSARRGHTDARIGQPGGWVGPDGPFAYLFAGHIRSGKRVPDSPVV